MDILGLEQKIISTVEIAKAKLRGDTVYPLEGHDLAFWGDRSIRWANALISYMNIDEANTIRGDALYQDIRDRVKRYIEKGGPKGVCRARWYEPYDRLYTYTDDTLDVTVAQLVIRGTDILEDRVLAELITNHPVRWVVYENSYHMVASHQFVDGCVYAEMLSVPLDNPVIDWKIIPAFTYIPGITELIGVVPGIGKIPPSIIHMKRNLSVDSDWKTSIAQEFIFQDSVKRIKHIKQYIADNYGKMPYGFVLACISVWEIMRCTEKKQLTIGLSTGFKPNATIHRFNNFAAITFVVKRPAGFDSMDVLTQFSQVVEQVIEYIQSMKSQAIASYIISNVYNLNYYLNDLLDMVVSPAPTSMPVQYNGHECSIDSVHLIGTSMPIYCGWWTSNSDAKCNIINRSHDVDLTKRIDLHALTGAMGCVEDVDALGSTK